MVRAAIFLYDCSRLFFLLILTGALSGPLGMFRGVDQTFPYMTLAAPNALFPLMSFFLLFRFEISRPYLPLYISGKTLGLLSILLWLFFLFSQAGPSGLLELMDQDSARPMAWIFLTGIVDLGTILGMILLQINMPSKKAPESPSFPEAPQFLAAPEKEGP
ncbi:MAG: hypothetical protein LBP60_05785 [Spirochaetaceae bacterium]|nr:hypothetical protein [Spirochaetaceae bacterium]